MGMKMALIEEVSRVLFKASSGQLVSRARNAFSLSSPSSSCNYSSASAAAGPLLSSSYNRTPVPPLRVGEGASSLRTGCLLKERFPGAAERRRSAGFVAGFASAESAGRREVAVSAVTMTAGVEVAEKMDPVQQRLMFDDECILVDEKDNVVGHDSKYNCHLMEKIEAENLLHRAFSVFLFNSKNELLLQKRSATKVTFPLVWTNTCCSHPLYRDSELIKENHLGVRNAAQRKLFDELGIKAPDAPVDNFTCLGRILYKAASDGKWGEHELDYLIFMKRDVTVEANPEEVADIMYVTREKLQELVQKAKAGEDGVKLSPWFQLVVENFLYDWWKKLEEGTLADVADMETIHKLL